MKLRRGFLALSVFPATVFLLLFYSLAVHMRATLGGWPFSIGTAGFPPALAWHADLATTYFGIWFLFFLFLPVPAVAFLGFRRTRPAAFYLAIHEAAALLAFGAAFLAPAPFLIWWMD